MHLMASLGAKFKECEKELTWWRHTIRDRRRMKATYRVGVSPVVVYSMTKSGSMAVYRALQQRGDILALKAHALHPAAWRGRRSDPIYTPGVRAQLFDLTHSNRMVRFEIIDQSRPCRFIALVRDPIATNVSGFHYNLPSFAQDPRAFEKADEMPAARLAQLFLERYPHHLTLEWFDLEPKRILGIDVYASPFSWQQGWSTYRQGPNELLVLRSELPDEAKAQVIAEFLGLSSVRIGRVNTANEHGRGGWTNALKRELALHRTYINSMVDSQYSQHFWSPTERAAMRDKWIASGDTLECS